MAKQKYKVSYTFLYGDKKEKKRREVTAITYDKKSDAQKYADQLNRGVSYKNARVRKA